MVAGDKNPKPEREKPEDDDYFVFIPDKDMKAIDHALLKMECARQEFHRIRDGMKPSGEREVTSGTDE
jgi:hypothetical protein